MSTNQPLPLGTLLDSNGDVNFESCNNLDSANGNKARAILWVRDQGNWTCFEITGPGYDQQADISLLGFKQLGVSVSRMGTANNQAAIGTNAPNGLRFTTETPGAPIYIGTNEGNDNRFDDDGVALACRILGRQQTKPNYRGGQDVVVLGPCATEPQQTPSIDGTGILYNLGGSLCWLDPNGNKTVIVPAKILTP